MLTLLLCPCLGLTAPNQLKATASNQDEEEVRNFIAFFVRAFEDLDWTKFRSCFAEAATIFYPEFFSRRVEGNSNIDSAWQQVFQNIKIQSGKSRAPYMDLNITDAQVQILQDAAVVTFHVKHAGTVVERRTLVVQKRSRRWKIVHLHASNVDFGPEAK